MEILHPFHLPNQDPVRKEHLWAQKAILTSHWSCPSQPLGLWAMYFCYWAASQFVTATPMVSDATSGKKKRQVGWVNWFGWDKTASVLVSHKMRASMWTTMWTTQWVKVKWIKYRDLLPQQPWGELQERKSRMPGRWRSCFLKIYFMFVWNAELQSDGETQREIFHSPASFPKELQCDQS